MGFAVGASKLSQQQHLSQPQHFNTSYSSSCRAVIRSLSTSLTQIQQSGGSACPEALTPIVLHGQQHAPLLLPLQAHWHHVQTIADPRTHPQ
jgi:hypothetical protein